MPTRRITCPNCEESLESLNVEINITGWSTATLVPPEEGERYEAVGRIERYLRGELEFEDSDTEWGDHTTLLCPECGDELDIDLIRDWFEVVDEPLFSAPYTIRPSVFFDQGLNNIGTGSPFRAPKIGGSETISLTQQPIFNENANTCSMCNAVNANGRETCTRCMQPLQTTES